MAIGISGVDEEVFQDLMEGDEDLYTSLLKSFIVKTPDVLIKLKNVSNETLADYAITMHGLKGACANICAEDAKKAASNLEQMSRKGNLAGVQAANGAFLKQMEELMGNLQNWLNSHQ